MSLRSSHTQSFSLAFTLVEMITVMAIITVLIALAVPATNSILRGNDLTTGAQNLSNLLSLARQQALTQNRPVEVRLYKFADPNVGETVADPGTWKYRAMQIFAISEASGAIPIGSDALPSPAGTPAATPPAPIALDKVQRFPPTFIIDSGKTLSSLIYGAQTQSGVGPGAILNTKPTRALPVVEKQYHSVSFRFYPDGSTSLGTAPATSDVGSWFITAHQLVSGDNPAVAPANFATLQIDPSNGNIREFRP